MRAELIGHFKACMTEIYLHILCAHGRLYPHAPVGNFGYQDLDGVRLRELNGEPIRSLRHLAGLLEAGQVRFPTAAAVTH